MSDQPNTARAALERLQHYFLEQATACNPPKSEWRNVHDDAMRHAAVMAERELVALDKIQEAESDDVMSALSAYYKQRAEEDEIRARKDEESALAEYYMLSELSDIRGDQR